MINISNLKDLNSDNKGFIYLENSYHEDDSLKRFLKWTFIERYSVPIHSVTGLCDYNPIDIVKLINKNKLLLTCSSFIGDSFSQLDDFIKLLSTSKDIIYIELVGYLYETIKSLYDYDDMSKMIIEKVVSNNIIISYLDEDFFRMIKVEDGKLVEVTMENVDWLYIQINNRL